MSDQNFVLSGHDGVLVVHNYVLSSEKKISCSTGSVNITKLGIHQRLPYMYYELVSELVFPLSFKAVKPLFL